MSNSGNLPSSTPLKESSKLINNNTSIPPVKSVSFNLYLLRASLALNRARCCSVLWLCLHQTPLPISWVEPLSKSISNTGLGFFFWREICTCVMLFSCGECLVGLLKGTVNYNKLLFEAPFPCLCGWWFCSAPNDHVLTFGVGGDRNLFLVGAVCCVLLHHLFFFCLVSRVQYLHVVVEVPVPLTAKLGQALQSKLFQLLQVVNSWVQTDSMLAI